MKYRFSINIHTIILGALACLVFGYVWQTNTQAESSFVARDLESQKAVLTDSIKKLTWDISAARSLSHITARAQALAFTKPKQVSFIEVGLSTVAAATEPIRAE